MTNEVNDMQWFNVGRIVNTHGIRGEVRVISTTDFEEQRFKIGNRIAIFKKDAKKPEWVTIDTMRRHKNFILLSFEGLHNINLVEQYKEGMIKITQDQMVDDELDEHEYYHFEILNCIVLSEDGDEIGIVTDILQTGANDVWEITAKNGKKHYIPYIADVVKDINIDDKKIIIHVMEGLL